MGSIIYLPLTHSHQRYLRDYQAQSHSDLQFVDARFNMTFWGELPYLEATHKGNVNEVCLAVENWERTMYSEHMVGLFSSGYLPPLRKWSISSLAHLARRYCANRLRYCSLFSSVTSISSPCSTSGTICRYKCPCGGVHVHEGIDVGVWNKTEKRYWACVCRSYAQCSVHCRVL